MLLCFLHHPMDGCRDTHPTCELKTGKAFLWESGGGSRRSLHTNRSIAQIFVGVVFEFSSHLYNFCCARIMFCIGIIGHQRSRCPNMCPFCTRKPAIHCPFIRLVPFLLWIESGIMSYMKMCLDSCWVALVQIGRAESPQ